MHDPKILYAGPSPQPCRTLTPKPHALTRKPCYPVPKTLLITCIATLMLPRSKAAARHYNPKAFERNPRPDPPQTRFLEFEPDAPLPVLKKAPPSTWDLLRGFRVYQGLSMERQAVRPGGPPQSPNPRSRNVRFSTVGN